MALPQFVQLAEHSICWITSGCSARLAVADLCLGARKHFFEFCDELVHPVIGVLLAQAIWRERPRAIFLHRMLGHGNTHVPSWGTIRRTGVDAVQTKSGKFHMNYWAILIGDE